MTLTLHNTPTRKDEMLVPLDGNTVTLYTCGPTVYNFLHVGNWSAYIFWDILVRTLIADGYNVKRVMNLTDVGHLVSDEDEGEDKMQKGARREGKTAWEIANVYIEDFNKGFDELNFVQPQHTVRATDFIPQQLDLIRILKSKGHTYQIDDGIYFDTSTFPRYADFAHLDLNAQRAGARVEFNTQKRQASDFALWKFSPKDEQRDMEWETPTDLLEQPSSNVMGFPGWHLECSAMAMNLLGETIDIHTGGIDHIPVHHTNEIAQSESASGKQFAQLWVHNNHLKSDGMKISKSLNNGYTLDQIKERGFSPLDFKLFILQGHYSNEGNFTFEALEAAKNRRTHWRNAAALRHQIHDTIVDDDDKVHSSAFAPLATVGAIKEALNDNLNTPEALRLVDDAFTKLEALPLDRIHRNSVIDFLEELDELLGLALIESSPDISDDTKQVILKRRQAREQKDWAASDALRDELLAQGIVVNDTAVGSIWQYAN